VRANRVRCFGVSERICPSGLWRLRKDGAPWTFARSDRTGMCFGMVVLAVKRRPNLRPRRSPYLPSSVAARQRRALRAGQFGCVLAARWIGLTAIKGGILRRAASLSILGTKPATPNACHSSVNAVPIRQPAIVDTDPGDQTKPCTNTGTRGLRKPGPSAPSAGMPGRSQRIDSQGASIMITLTIETQLRG